MTAPVDTTTAVTIDLIGRPARLRSTAVTTTITSTTTDNRLRTAFPPCLPLPPEDVTVLPIVGERVTTRSTTGEAVTGQWLGLDPNATAVDHVTALMLVGEHVRSVAFDPGQIDARSVVDRTPSQDERAAMTALYGQVEVLNNVQTAHRRQIDDLVSDAHEYADDNDLCERFDDFMDNHGFPRRSRDYDLKVEVTQTLYLTRSATSAEAAIDALTAEDVFSYLTASSIDFEAEED